MAARDGRKSWKRLLVYISAASIGIAALVAAGSLQHNLEEALSEQAKPLIGADVVARNRRAFTIETEALFASLPHPRLREIELNTVAFFPEKSGSRLLEIRAIEKGFPFYGNVKTEPAGAVSEIFSSPSLLLEENVMAEFELAIGDTVELGRAKFRIAAALKMVPGEAMASVFAAPRAFIALAYLKDTGLLQGESLARHRLYFKIENADDLKAALAKLEPVAKEESWRLTTVEERRKSLGRRAENASKFLKVAALIALLLGGIGIASILYVYAKEKAPAVATLKCLGAPANITLGIFLLQGMVLGMVGTLIGVTLGVALQWLLPSLLNQFILVEIPFFISWRSLATGAAIGFGVTFLFTLLPLLSLRSISPLAAIRANDAPQSRNTFLFRAFQHLRALVPPTWPYAWRQGLANVFRPNNQTPVLVPALGFGSALIFMIAFLNSSLLQHIGLSTSNEEPTLALIDIQTHQRNGVRALLEKENVRVVDQASFVSMRIAKLKNVPVEELTEADKQKMPDWVLRREYRSSYRSHLGHSEKILAGAWPPGKFSPDGVVPISLEEGIAEDLGVTIGDNITFDVLGLPIDTVVVALRKVDWFQLRPNFFVIFPEGVLEQAPQFTVMLAKVPTIEKTGAVQKAMRKEFPNVSTVDLRMVLDTLNSYFDKVAMALNFMALFVVTTGLMILAGALISGRQERLREATLLRTLGAGSTHVRTIHLIEYGFIGFFAALTGLVLGMIGSYLVAERVFEIGFRPTLVSIITGVGGMIFVSTATGFFLGRGMLQRPPLETLREE